MEKRWRQYVIFHLEMLLFAVLFAAWALLMRRLFPYGYYDCLLNDLLHLYCPLCGGTRAFLSVLSLQVAAAFRQNAGVMLAVPVLFFCEGRALWLLFSKREGRLLPYFLRVPCILYLIVWALARNTAMLLGFDPLGDNAAYWATRVSTPRALLFLPLSLLLCAAFWVAVAPPKRLARHKPLAVWVAALLPALILTVLHARAWILLFELPVLAVLILVKILIDRKRRRSDEIPDFFRK